MDFLIKEKKMADEEVKTETAPVTQVAETKPETKITIDFPSGKSYSVDMELGKELVAIRDELKKSKATFKASEAEKQAAIQKSTLLEAMKNQDIEAVKAQVSQEYVDKINQYESKIFRGEVKSLLATAGVLPTALDDAVNLAMSGVKATLEGDKIKLGDKDAKDAVDEFVKSRPHLVAVQATQQGKKVGVTPVVPKVNGDFQKFTQTLFTKK